MTHKQLKEGNLILNTISTLKEMKQKISDDFVFKASFVNNDKEILAAGKSAMLAVIDERIDSLQQQLNNL